LEAVPTKALIWSMRAQPFAAQKFCPAGSNFTVDFVLIATEERAIPVVQDVARGKACMTRDQSLFVK
jgi:hypothetical protein